MPPFFRSFLGSLMGSAPLGLTLLGTLSCLPLSDSLAYERLQGPTGVVFCDRALAQPGYVFFGVGGHSYLLDLDGRIVHTWPIGTSPHLLPDGHVLDATKDDPSGTPGFREVDWDGRTTWEYAEHRPGYQPHHDWLRIQNRALGAPTTLYLANRSLTQEQALAVGADPAKGPYAGAQVDAIVEVDQQGRIVWEWCFYDHLIQDLSPALPNYTGEGKTVAAFSGRLNVNLPGRPLRRDWLHCNSLDYDPASGHLVINSVQGELYVIDHDGTFVPNNPAASIAKAATPEGDFLYRFGDPARYGQGEAPRILENWDNASSGNKQMGGSHDAHWIAAGLPGAGHLLVFNNGQYLFQHTPQSSILEIDPHRDAEGRDQARYVNPPTAGYRRETYDKDTHNSPREVSRQVVGGYRALNSHGFFSHIGGSSQRLPSGGLFICSDTEGHLFEITADGHLAWEFINPLTREGSLSSLGDQLPMTNSLFRAYRIAPDHPALAGRTLSPQGSLLETHSNPSEQRGRLPWPIAHARELDLNQDGVVTREEMTAEIDKTFQAYDANHDGRLSNDEIEKGEVRSALGGFVRQHAREVDVNQDGQVTLEELRQVVLRMFDRADTNHDGKLSGAELTPAPSSDPKPSPAQKQK